jgi:hypothetical protein
MAIDGSRGLVGLGRIIVLFPGFPTFITQSVDYKITQRCKDAHCVTRASESLLFVGIFSVLSRAMA